MAPVRGAKKRKRPEKPAPAPTPGLPLPPLPDGSDWWGVFYRRVAGRLSSPYPPSLPASLCSLECALPCSFRRCKLDQRGMVGKYLVLGNACVCAPGIDVVRGWIWRELELQFVAVDM
jgi:hypothetical protein